MSRPQTDDPLAEWRYFVPEFSMSPGEFYVLVEQALVRRKVPKCNIKRMLFREGSLWTARRAYLRVERNKLIFDLCASPFGTMYFFSSWLHVKKSLLARLLLAIPVLSTVAAIFIIRFSRPPTYHELDTAHAFHQVVHGAVLEAVDELTKAQGLRQLREEERKPQFENFRGGP